MLTAGTTRGDGAPAISLKVAPISTPAWTMRMRSTTQARIKAIMTSSCVFMTRHTSVSG